MKKLFLSLVLCLFLISFISANIYQTEKEVALRIPCSEINCSEDNNISIFYPNSSIFIDNSELTIENGYASINIELDSTTGVYYYYLFDTTDYYSNSFEVSRTGKSTPENIELLFIIASIIIFGYLLITLLNILAHFVQLPSHIRYSTRFPKVQSRAGGSQVPLGGLGQLSLSFQPARVLAYHA